MSQQIELYRKLNFHKIGSPTVGGTVTCTTTGAKIKIGSQPGEAIASIIDGYGESLALDYSAGTYSFGTSYRLYALEINADTGSVNCTGDVNLGAIKGRVVAGTTQTNCGISGIVGTLDVADAVNLISNYNGVCGVVDFYGTTVLGGSQSHVAALSGVVWNEVATSSTGAGNSICGVEAVQNVTSPTMTGGINAAFHARAGASALWQYGIYMTQVYRPFYATASLTGATSASKKAMEIAITDTATISSNINYGMYIGYAQNAAKTGSAEVNGLGIDITAIASVPNLYCISLYTTQTGNPTIGNCFPISIYMADMGTACSGIVPLDLEINQTSALASGARHAFIRARNHSATRVPNAVILCEGNNAATYFIDCDANAGNGFVNTGGAGTCTVTGGWVKLAIDVNGTTYYIPAGVTLSNS